MTMMIVKRHPLGDRLVFIASASVMLAACFIAAPVHAQDAPPASTGGEAEKKQDAGKQDKPPSLDDLLGIEGDDASSADGAADVAERQQNEELEQRLGEQRMADAFEGAIEQMQLSAELLDEKFDAGLGTQRVQEAILAGLDTLIDEAKKSQNQSAAQSMTQQQQQQRNPGKQDQQQRQDQQQQDQNQQDRNQNPNDATEGDPPGREDGDLNTVLDETRSEWGSLPARIREQLLHGRREKFSSLYDRMTREYYRRLAEDSSN